MKSGKNKIFSLQETEKLNQEEKFKASSSEVRKGGEGGKSPLYHFFFFFFFVQRFTSHDSALHRWSTIYVLGNIGH